MSTELEIEAHGERELLAFVAAWRGHAEKLALVYPEPKVCVEEEMAVLRFPGQNVSVSIWPETARIANVAEWMTDESLAHWTPIALTSGMPLPCACLYVAEVLDRRIPW